MKLLYFNVQRKAWCFNEHNNQNLLSAGASLYNVFFIIITETRADIIKRINLGVPRQEAMDCYPHAFMMTQMMSHQNLFPKGIKTKEIQYFFEKGTFCFLHNEKPVYWAEHVLLTPDFKIHVSA